MRKQIRTGIVIATLCLTPIVAGVALAIVPAQNLKTFTTTDLVMILASGVLDLGAAVVIVSALGEYKTKMRLAYGALAFSIIAAVIGTIQIPIIEALDLDSSAWAQSGGIVLPYMAASLGIYMSMRGFARLIGVTGWLTRASVILPLGVALAIASIWFPHVPVTTDEIKFDASNVIETWSGALYVAAGILMLKVRKKIGAHYVSAVSWLTLPIFGAAFAFLGYVIHNLLAPQSNDVFTLFIDVLGIFIGLAWLRAAYAFAETEEF